MGVPFAVGASSSNTAHNPRGEEHGERRVSRAGDSDVAVAVRRSAGGGDEDMEEEEEEGYHDVDPKVETVYRGVGRLLTR